MNLIRKRNLERRLRCIDTRRTGRRTATALSGPSIRLLDAAQELERATGRRREALTDGGAVTAIEQMSPALEAVANVNLSLSLLVRELLGPESQARSQDAGPPEATGGASVERATLLLVGASQNIRIAAEASKLAAAAVRTASPAPE